MSPRRKKKRSQAELALFPEGAPDPLPQPHRADQAQFITGWACARCLQPKEPERRTCMIFFGSENRESVGVNVCTTCALVIQSCLEHQTTMTPIHAPPSPKLEGVGEGVEPEAERLHPWEV